MTTGKRLGIDLTAAQAAIADALAKGDGVIAVRSGRWLGKGTLQKQMRDLLASLDKSTAVDRK